MEGKEKNAVIEYKSKMPTEAVISCDTCNKSKVLKVDKNGFVNGLDQVNDFCECGQCVISLRCKEGSGNVTVLDNTPTKTN